VLDSVLRQAREARFLPGGRDHTRPHLSRERRCREPDRSRTAPDQQRLTAAEIEPGGQRAVGGLQHLGNGTDGFPREIGSIGMTYDAGTITYSA
jgi:hypothetical protein